MKILHASCSKKGQMKIQQMAFVLVALMIFFVIVTLFYFSVRVKTLEQNANTLKEESTKELVRKLASSPELSWSRGCDNCIDMDKAMLLKDRKSYVDFWNLDYLAIEKVYPKTSGDCTIATYPNCNKIIIVGTNIGIPSDAFVSLCRLEGNGGYEKCELGRIYATGKGITS